MRCWHRLRITRNRLTVCRHCGVEVEECPCVRWRVVDPKCLFCDGSGWVAVVKGQMQRFREYVDVRM